MSVVQNYPEFKQPLDVLNRYEALGKGLFLQYNNATFYAYH